MHMCRLTYRAAAVELGSLDINIVMGQLRPNAGVERYALGNGLSGVGLRHDDHLGN